MEAPPAQPTVNPGTATSKVCRVFSRDDGGETRHHGEALFSIAIWGYPGGGNRGCFNETPAWVAMTLA